MTNISDAINECLTNKYINNRFIITDDMDMNQVEKIRADLLRMIGYCILFKDNKNIEEYMSIENRQEQIEFLKKQINIRNGLSLNDKDLFDYIFNNFILNGFVFCKGNINEQVINEEELKDIFLLINIFKKYDPMINPIGIHTSDLILNKSGRKFDGSPRNMFEQFNPLWFSQFSGMNYCYSNLNLSISDRKGYMFKDKEKSLKCITRLIEDLNMNKNDKELVISIFNKYWDKYYSYDQSISLIPTYNIYDEDDFKELYNFYINPNTLYNSDYLFDLVINSGEFKNNVCYLNKDISIDNIEVINISSLFKEKKELNNTI